MKEEFIKLRGERIEYVTDDIKSLVRFHTAGHGFLVVPRTSLYFNLARRIQKADGFGYCGRLAVYLEEDCQAPEFLSKLPKGEAIEAVTN